MGWEDVFVIFCMDDAFVEGDAGLSGLGRA